MMKYSTYHNLAEKEKKMSIYHTAIISSYKTEVNSSVTAP